MPFNTGRPKQAVPQLGHQRDRRIHIQPAVGNWPGKGFSILQRKVLKMRPPVDNFGERVRFYHHIHRRAFES